MEWFRLFTTDQFSLLYLCILFLVLIAGYAMGRNSAGRPFSQGKETEVPKENRYEPPFHDSQLEDQDYIETALIRRDEYPGRIPTVRE